MSEAGIPGYRVLRRLAGVGWVESADAGDVNHGTGIEGVLQALWEAGWVLCSLADVQGVPTLVVTRKGTDAAA